VNSRDLDGTPSTPHIHPPKLLRALMDYVPSEFGKYNIALEIMSSINQSEETNKKLKDFACSPRVLFPF
jgi:hypothetical protein